MFNQKDACFAVITSMVEVVDGKATMSAEQITEAAHELCAMTHDGKVEVKSQQKDLLQYWKGTVRNWLRRDTRLNGGIKDEPKFKRGPKESKEIKATKALIAHLEQDPEQNAERLERAKAVLEKLTAEAAKEKAKAAYDVADLPEELQALIAS